MRKTAQNAPRLTSRRDARPSLQWYPGDFLAETRLRRCSLAARGLWCHLLNEMWYENPRGRITDDPRKIIAMVTPVCIAKRSQIMAKLICELVDEGVCDHGPGNYLYSRRMYREWGVSDALRLKRQRAAKRGNAVRWGSRPSQTVAKIAASSSTSSSSSSSSSTSPSLTSNVTNAHDRSAMKKQETKSTDPDKGAPRGEGMRPLVPTEGAAAGPLAGALKNAVAQANRAAEGNRRRLMTIISAIARETNDPQFLRDDWQRKIRAVAEEHGFGPLDDLLDSLQKNTDAAAKGRAVMKKPAAIAAATIGKLLP